MAIKENHNPFSRGLDDNVHLFPGWCTPCSSRHRTLLDPRRSRSALGRSRSCTHRICARVCRAARTSHRSHTSHHLKVKQSLVTEHHFLHPHAEKKIPQLAYTLKDNVIGLQKFILEAQGATLDLHMDFRGTRACNIWVFFFFLILRIHIQRRIPRTCLLWLVSTCLAHTRTSTLQFFFVFSLVKKCRTDRPGVLTYAAAV